MTEQSLADPILVSLAGALRVAEACDPSAIRAVDRAVDHLSTGLPFEFDGCELRITSFSRRVAGVVQVTDGVSCTCPSGRRPWCWHRAAFRLLIAEMALRNPQLLRYKIAEQTSVLDLATDDEVAYDEYGDFLADPIPARPAIHEIAPVAGSRLAAAQAAADALFS